MVAYPLIAAGLSFAGLPVQVQEDAARSVGLIGDKTLVVWVRIADLDQRGGSPLSLFDSAERFDAIVLGEIEPQRWMAGSDFFRRTPQPQADYPIETAHAGELVQVAITYRGAEVTLYRNGETYARHTIEAPQEFAPDASVLLGVRYLGAMGAIGHFAGDVEDARIYDRALSIVEIRSLEADSAAGPPPIGWWSFGGGSTEDLMGTFPSGQLRGGAVVVDGALRLNGTSAYMVSRMEYGENQLMFYKALSPSTGNMWDTWLYVREGTYYLYYLADEGPSWDNISMARSHDGVRWEELGPVLRKSEGVDWMGTGSTWASPVQEGRFIINFSEWRGDRQTIFFAESDDLVHWNRLGGETEFTQDTRWYQEKGRWDCIYAIPRPGGGLLGYFTADPIQPPGVGFAESLDGVIWEALPPPPFTEGAPHGEAGAVEELGGRFYLMLGAAGGMRTLVADRPEGPFALAERNPDLLAGQSGLHTYFARFFRSPDGVLVNHHSRMRNGQVFFSPLKRAVVDAEGTLRLAWWEGNDVLKKTAHLRPIGRRLDAAAGVIVEGAIEIPYRRGAAPGLWIGMIDGGRVGILVGPDGVTQIGPMLVGETAVAAEETIDRQLDLRASVPFRLLLKHSLVEFYLDDVLIQCYSLPVRADGHVGTLGDGRYRVSGVRAWQLPPAEGQAASSGHRGTL